MKICILHGRIVLPICINSLSIPLYLIIVPLLRYKQNSSHNVSLYITCPTLDMCVLFHVLLSTSMVLLAMAVIW